MSMARQLMAALKRTRKGPSKDCDRFQDHVTPRMSPGQIWSELCSPRGIFQAGQKLVKATWKFIKHGQSKSKLAKVCEKWS